MSKFVNTQQSTPRRSQSPDNYPRMTGKFVLITAGVALAVMFMISKLFDALPSQVTASSLDMAGFVVVAFVFGWLACLLNDTYLTPYRTERSRKAALRELGLDNREEAPRQD